MTQVTAQLVKSLRDKSGAGMMDCKKALIETNGDFEAAIDWLRKKGIMTAAKKSGRSASEGLVALKSDGQKTILFEINSETDFVSRNAQFQELVEKIASNAFKHFNEISDIDSLKNLKTGNLTIQEEINESIATIGENLNLRRIAKCQATNGIVVNYTHNSVAENMGKIVTCVVLESNADKAALTELGKKLAMHAAAARPECLAISNVPSANVEREKAIFVEQAKSSGKPESIIEKMVEGRIRKYYEEVVFLEQVFIIDNKTKITDVIAEEAKKLGHPIKLVDFARFELGEGIEKEEADFASEVAKMVK